MVSIGELGANVYDKEMPCTAHFHAGSYERDSPCFVKTVLFMVNKDKYILFRVNQSLNIFFMQGSQEEKFNGETLMAYQDTLLIWRALGSMLRDQLSRPS